MRQLFPGNSQLERFKSGLFLLLMDELGDHASLKALSAKNQNSPILIKNGDKYFLFGFLEGEWKTRQFLEDAGQWFENLPFYSEGRLLQATDYRITREIRKQLRAGHALAIKDYHILKTPKISGEGYDYFVFQKSRSEKLGEGSYGKVYKAYRVKNPEEPLTEGNLDRENFSAIKILKKKEEIESFMEESQIANRFFQGHKPVQDGSSAYYIMPFLPGDTFNNFVAKKRGWNYRLALTASIKSGAKPNAFYIDYSNEELRYTVIDPRKNEVTGILEEKDFDLLGPEKKAALLWAWKNLDRKNLSPFFEDILQITSEKGHTESDTLSLLEALDLAIGFADEMVGFHHERKSGKAIIHGDIKEKNIIVEEHKKTKKLIPHIHDFGFAVELEGEDDFPEFLDGLRGTPFTMPPEFSKGKHHTRSDIYSLLPVLLKLFGVRNPYDLKGDYEELLGDYKFKVDIITPFNFARLLDNFSEFSEGGLLAKCPINVKYTIKTFLQRMGLYDPNLRPSSDELLRFFTSLRLLLLIKKNPDEFTSELEKQYCAELATLASGIWSELQKNEEQKDLLTTENGQDYILTCFNQGVLSKFTLDVQGRGVDFEKPLPSDIFNLLVEHRSCKIASQLKPELSKLKDRCHEIEEKLLTQLLYKKDPRDMFVYCLTANFETVKNSFLANLQDRDCIRLHQYMVRYRTGIIRELGVGKFSDLLDAVSERLLKNVNEYRKETEKLSKAAPQQDYKTFWGRFFGCKISDKIKTTTILIDSIKNGSAAPFFASGPNAARYRRAAKQGELGRCSAELVDYITHDLRKISAS